MMSHFEPLKPGAFWSIFEMLCEDDPVLRNHDDNLPAFQGTQYAVCWRTVFLLNVFVQYSVVKEKMGGGLLQQQWTHEYEVNKLIAQTQENTAVMKGRLNEVETLIKDTLLFAHFVQLHLPIKPAGTYSRTHKGLKIFFCIFVCVLLLLLVCFTNAFSSLQWSTEEEDAETQCNIVDFPGKNCKYSSRKPGRVESHGETSGRIRVVSGIHLKNCWNQPKTSGILCRIRLLHKK